MVQNENFGQPKQTTSAQQHLTKHLLGGESILPAEPEYQGIIRFTDKRLWIISFVSCCFEGTNFLVLFFWPGILQEAYRQATPDSSNEVPYGVIFATFMAAMILGAQLFNAVGQEERITSTQGESRLAHWMRTVVRSNNLLALAILISGGCLLLTVFLSNQIGILCAFLVFEVCNGIYVPCIAYQRGIVVNEANRAGMYGLMKLPLFVFVIAALLTAVEG